MKTLFVVCIFFCVASSLAQPARLELGMKRSIAQTFMDKAKIDFYYKEKTVYVYPDSVFFTIEFNEEEYCKGFYWSAKNKTALEKTLTENGFTKNDTVYTAKGFAGYFKKEENNAQTIYRLIATQTEVKEIKPITEETPKEKPFYGFSILGIKVWEKKEKAK